MRMRDCFFFACLAWVLTSHAHGIPLSYKEMNRGGARVYLYGDYHKETLDHLEEFEISKKVLFGKLNQLAREPQRPAFILWEISSLYLSSPHILQQYKNLFIVEQAVSIGQVIQNQQFTHMKFLSCDDVRHGTLQMAPILTSLLNVGRSSVAQEVQNIRRVLNEEVIISLRRHLQLQDSSLLRTLVMVPDHFDIKKLMGYVSMYLNGTRDFIRWLYLFSDFERNKIEIESDFERQASFLVLFPPNLEAVMNVLVRANNETSFVLYFGRNHIQYDGRYPSISTMLKEFGFVMGKEEETRILGS